MDKCLEETFERAQQSQGMLVVMHLDLDDFKIVNDGLGHQIGNLLLVAVAARLQLLVEPSDTVAWLTSDEFALVLAN
nr:GGDEF domain-containing protein [Halomonas arcis]